jgi:hypothetical protein
MITPPRKPNTTIEKSTLNTPLCKVFPKLISKLNVARNANKSPTASNVWVELPVAISNAINRTTTAAYVKIPTTVGNVLVVNFVRPIVSA